MEKLYDVIIIGTGPAGYTASIYLSRYKLSNLIIGKEPGGQISEAHLVENYPGFSSITGFDLMNKFKEHVEKFNPDMLTAEVRAIKKQKDGNFLVIDENHKEYQSKAVILATGMSYKKLGIPGEADFIGKGVSFCFTCDGPFFRNKTVVMIGGGDSAAMGASYLANVGKQVYMIFRKEELAAEPFWRDKVNSNPKIELIPMTNVIEIKGEKFVQEVILDKPYKGQTSLPTDGVFIEVGSIPSLVLAKSLGVEANEKGFIKVKANQETNIEGAFAAGDITDASNGYRQVVAAAAEGAIAAGAVFKYLQNK